MDRDYARRNIPRTILGINWRQWRVADLQLIVGHYRDEMPEAPFKIDLMQELDLVVREYGLQVQDRIAILEANEAGGQLPPRNTRVKTDGEASSDERPGPNTGLASTIQHRTHTEDLPVFHARGNAIAGFPSEIIKTINSGPEATPALTCIVCYDDYDQTDKPDRPPTTACTHPVNVCTGCLAQSIYSQTTSKIWDHIDCPSCRLRMTADDVNRFGDRATVEG